MVIAVKPGSVLANNVIDSLQASEEDDTTRFSSITEILLHMVQNSQPNTINPVWESLAHIARDRVKEAYMNFQDLLSYFLAKIGDWG